jgi:cell division protein FtsL
MWTKKNLIISLIVLCLVVITIVISRSAYKNYQTQAAMEANINPTEASIMEKTKLEQLPFQVDDNTSDQYSSMDLRPSTKSNDKERDLIREQMQLKF